MGSLIIDEKDIEPYMPPDYSDTQKEQLFQFVLSVRQAVVDQMPIGLSFYGNTRVVLPHNVFLQNKTPRTSGIFQSRSQERSFTGMLPVKNGTEKCIGMDAYQVFSQKSESRNGWKYFNLHEINNLRLHTLEEVRSIFDLEGDYIWEGANLDT